MKEFKREDYPDIDENTSVYIFEIESISPPARNSKPDYVEVTKDFTASYEAV